MTVNSFGNKVLIQLFLFSCSPGYGSIASPAKEEKVASNKNESPTKQSPASESTQEMVDGRKMFESWLFDKLPFITAMELQVRMDSYWKRYTYHLLFCLRYMVEPLSIAAAFVTEENDRCKMVAVMGK